MIHRRSKTSIPSARTTRGTPTTQKRCSLDCETLFRFLASWPPRWLTLAGLGALAALIYWLGLIIPYNLFRFGLKPRVDISSLTLHNPAAQAEFVLLLAIECGITVL